MTGAGGRAGDGDDGCGGQRRHSAWGGGLTGDGDEGRMTAAAGGRTAAALGISDILLGHNAGGRMVRQRRVT